MKQCLKIFGISLLIAVYAVTLTPIHVWTHSAEEVAHSEDDMSFDCKFCQNIITSKNQFTFNSEITIPVVEDFSEKEDLTYFFSENLKKTNYFQFLLRGPPFLV